MRRYKLAGMDVADDFGAWFRQLRTARGFPSAAALSRATQLNVTYINEMERGKAKPKPATIDQIAETLGLTPAEHGEFRKRAGIARVPPEVRAELAGPPIPGLVIWNHLPGALYRIPHEYQHWMFDGPDDIAAAVVRAGASLLAWSVLRTRPPSHRAKQRLLKAAARIVAERGYSESAFENRPDKAALAALASAATLAQAWREELFSKPRDALRIAGMLKSWTYVEYKGFPPRSGMLVFRFASAQLQESCGVNRAFPEDIVTLHDAMVAHRLWELLDMEDHGQLRSSCFPQWLPHGLVQSIRTLHSLKPAALTRRLTRDWREMNKHVEAVRLVRMGLRAFEVTELARQLADAVALDQRANLSGLRTDIQRQCDTLEETVLKADAAVRDWRTTRSMDDL